MAVEENALREVHIDIFRGEMPWNMQLENGSAKKKNSVYVLKE